MESEKTEGVKGYTAPKEHFLYRIRFTKGEEVKFIGHLDIMRLFQRANKRAGLPVAYSQGFNPHQLLSFASPLSLGAVSSGEYGDFEMAEKIEPSLLVERLNPVLPLGIKVTDCVLIRKKTESAMAAIEAAKYKVILPEEITPEMVHQHLDSFLVQSEIIAMKKTKKKQQEENIREDIFVCEDISKDNVAQLYLFVASGSRRNLKPLPVVESFYTFLGLPFSASKINYERLDLLRMEGDTLVSLTEGIGIRQLEEDTI